MFCPGVLCVGPRVEVGQRVAEMLADWPLVVLCDDAHRTASTNTRFLWTTFTRFEPAADLYATRTRVHRHHLVHSGAIVIDARFKNEYPDELFCDPDTAATVSSRWKAYFPKGGVEMGDSDQGHLDQA